MVMQIVKVLVVLVILGLASPILYKHLRPLVYTGLEAALSQVKKL